MTQAGPILGTAAYMSPEQLGGNVVDRRTGIRAFVAVLCEMRAGCSTFRGGDRRTDIWAFGAVLYEMLAGRRAFGGEDRRETVLNVRRVEPDWAALPEDVPPLVRGLLRGCLVKDPRTRVADVAVIRFALAHASTPAHIPVSAK